MARILVVDDDQDVIEIVRYTLSRDKHEMLEALDGKEGLARAIADRPDLIILDVMMPEMDGLTVSNHLAVTPETKNIPVIILTAKGRMRETFDSAPNVHCFMDKPFEPIVLQDKIRDILMAKRPKSA